jgi:aryl-alcohol dehydrogenase-like predicted oxidoreductase
MEKRELGKSGLYVSELALGTMSFPNNEVEAKKIVDTAIHAGINFFDTANIYASRENEKIVGKALKEHRENIILATKVGNKLNPDGQGWTWDPTKRHITEEVKHSLHRLGTDYIDLYQLHGGTMEDNIDETIDTFESLKKEGLIRQYGISSIRPTVIKRFLEKSTAISVMMQFSLLDRRPEEWFQLISDSGASIITRGTLAKGYLTMEGQERAKVSNGFALYNATELQNTVNSLNEVEDIHAASIAFVLQNETVASALVGARSTKQLLDSIVAYEKGCPSEQLDKLINLTTKHKYDEHRI